MRIDASFLATSDPLPAIEAICIAIAEADPTNNPCGLFCHPLTEAETTLVFGADAMQHQQALARLVEEFYISCNHPLHIQVETAATDAVTAALSEQVRRHLKFREQGGYIDESRPASSWLWRCNHYKSSSATALDSYRAAGGTVTLVQPSTQV